MLYGIYYAYWEKEWGGDFIPYIRKVKKLGFDILEVACHNFSDTENEYLYQLKEAADVICGHVSEDGIYTYCKENNYFE